MDKWNHQATRVTWVGGPPVWLLRLLAMMMLLPRASPSTLERLLTSPAVDKRRFTDSGRSLAPCIPGCISHRLHVSQAASLTGCSSHGHPQAEAQAAASEMLACGGCCRQVPLHQQEPKCASLHVIQVKACLMAACLSGLSATNAASMVRCSIEEITQRVGRNV